MKFRVFLFLLSAFTGMTAFAQSSEVARGEYREVPRAGGGTQVTYVQSGSPLTPGSMKLDATASTDFLVRYFDPQTRSQPFRVRVDRILAELKPEGFPSPTAYLVPGDSGPEVVQVRDLAYGRDVIKNRYQIPLMIADTKPGTQVEIPKATWRAAYAEAKTGKGFVAQGLIAAMQNRSNYSSMVNDLAASGETGLVDLFKKAESAKLNENAKASPAREIVREVRDTVGAAR
jgi:hypothetical protein